MKKVILAVAVIIVTGLAALTVKGKENKTEKVKMTIENTQEVASSSESRTLATAD